MTTTSNQPAPGKKRPYQKPTITFLQVRESNSLTSYGQIKQKEEKQKQLQR